MNKRRGRLVLCLLVVLVIIGITSSWLFVSPMVGAVQVPNVTGTVSGSTVTGYSVLIQAIYNMVNSLVRGAQGSGAVVSNAEVSSGVVSTSARVSTEVDFLTARFDRIPNFAKNPTVNVTESGLWSTIPVLQGLNSNDVVLINDGVKVVYDVENVIINTIGVAGNLTFVTNKNTSLNIANLLVFPQGYLEIGTEANPIQSGAKVEITITDTPFNFTNDPEMFGNGVLNFGKLRMHGAPLSESFVRLSIEPVVTVKRSSPVTKQDFDKIVTKYMNISLKVWSSDDIWNYLVTNGFIDSTGKVLKVGNLDFSLSSIFPSGERLDHARSTINERISHKLHEPINTLTLKRPVSGWKSGDSLIIPDTRQLGGSASATLKGAQNPRKGGIYFPEWEELTIQSIVGNVINLTSPLEYDHFGARDGNGKLDFLPHVADLTRNIVIRSENPNGIRGHTISFGRANIDMRYIQLKDMGRTMNMPINTTVFRVDFSIPGHGDFSLQLTAGAIVEQIFLWQILPSGYKARINRGEIVVTDRNGDVVDINATYTVTHVGTNQIARYAIHTHHVVGPTTPHSNGYQFTIKGNSVDNSISGTHDGFNFPKWGITIHGSHYGLIQDNVVYNMAGAAIVTEDGSETGNLFDKNIVIRSKSTRSGWRFSKQEFFGMTGREAGGFWFRGPNNRITNNVAANILAYDEPNTAFGYKFLVRSLGSKTIPLSQGDDPHINGRVQDMNAMPILQFENNEAYGSIGGGLTYWWVGAFGDDPKPEVGTTTIKDFKAWHTLEHGIFHYPASRIVIDGLIVRNKRSGSSRFQTGIMFGDYMTNEIVVRNVDIQGFNVGIVLPSFSRGSIIVENSFLRNRRQNLFVQTPFSTNGAKRLTAKSVIIRNVSFDSWGISTPVNIDTVYTAGNKNNIILLDEIYVYDYNGISGDNFQVFYPEQHPYFIVRQSFDRFIGAPEANLTNKQLWEKYHPNRTLKVPLDANTPGLAIAGAVAPCIVDPNDGNNVCPNALVYPGIEGYVFPLNLGPRLIITNPKVSENIVGTTVDVAYTTSGNITGVDHVNLKLDRNSEVMDFDGSYQFTNVPFGSHTINAFMVKADNSKVSGTDTSVTFNTVEFDQTTCASQGGSICTAGTYCPGSNLTASDSNACCSVACVVPSWNLCSECGGGLFDFDFCNKIECNSISQQCYFIDGFFINNCKVCAGAVCSDYKDSDVCVENHCGLGSCSWDGSSCVSVLDTTPLIMSLHVRHPENRSYVNMIVPLAFKGFNADQCGYQLDSNAKVITDCNFQGGLKIRPESLFVPENHMVTIFARNSTDEVSEWFNFSVEYRRRFIMRYTKFFGKGLTTDLASFNDTQLKKVGLILDDALYGRIEFRENIDLTLDANMSSNETDIDSVVSISHASISIISANGLSRPANITFYNISFTKPKILKDGVDCGDCRILGDIVGGELKVFVSGFSNYTVVQTPPTSPPPGSSSGSPGGGSSSSGGFTVQTDEDNETEIDDRDGWIDLVSLFTGGDDEADVALESPSDLKNNKRILLLIFSTIFLALLAIYVVLIVLWKKNKTRKMRMRGMKKSVIFKKRR